MLREQKSRFTPRISRKISGTIFFYIFLYFSIMKFTAIPIKVNTNHRTLGLFKGRIKNHPSFFSMFSCDAAALHEGGLGLFELSRGRGLAWIFLRGQTIYQLSNEKTLVFRLYRGGGLYYPIIWVLSSNCLATDSKCEATLFSLKRRMPSRPTGLSWTERQDHWSSGMN